MKRALIFVLPVILILSCKKENPPCTNCKKIHISGRVWDGSENKGIRGIPVNVYWQDLGICYSCPEVDAGHGRSDNQGYFDFYVQAEKDRFGMFGLFISVPVISGYIKEPEGESGRIIIMFRNEQDHYDSLLFTMYRKVALKLKLNRVMNDDFDLFQVSYRFGEKWAYFYQYTHPPVLPSEYQVETAANVFTKLTILKYQGFNVTSSLDSIKCLPFKNNILVLNY